MRTIPRTVILSLIVFSTTWVSMATAAEPGITTLSGSVAEPAAGQTRMQDTVGYAVSDPFGPIFHVEGNFGDGLGYDTGYWGGGLMLPYFTVPGKGLFFGAIEGSGTDDSGIVMNLGGGYRQYAPGWDRIFGVSGWYDFDSGHEDDYSRMGVSFESLGKYLDLRANGYFLLDTDSKEISNGLVGDPFFRQNFIIGLRQIITEIPYHGADFEVGGPVPVLGRYGLYAHAGAYYLDAEDFDSAIGVQARLDVAATEDVSVNVHFTNDDIFGFNANVSVAWQFPDGRAERWFKPRPVRDRLSSQVVRRERIPVRLERDVEPEPLINPDDSEPFFVVHTDPNRTAGTGDGTAENPFGSFEQARLANNPGIDIFRVIPRDDDSGTNLALNGPFVLFGTANTGFVQQRVLGSSIDHTILAEQGLFTFPGQTGGDLPVISNNVNNPASGVFVLANNNEISGIEVDGTGGNGIINTAPIVDFNLNRNRFVGHINATMITNATGTGFVEDNEFIGTPGTSDRGLLITNNLAGTLDMLVTGNTATGHDEAGFSVNANVNAAAIINTEVSGNEATENGNGFEFLVGGGEINLAFDDNNASENLNDDANGGGMVGTVTAGELNISSFVGNDLNDNVGNGVSLEAISGVGPASILVRNFTGNEITGNGAANGTANLANGVRLLADGITASIDAEIGSVFGDFNTISNNGLGTGGGHGIRIETENDGTVVGAITRNILTDHDFGQGISVVADSGTVDFGTLPGRRIFNNLIDDNTDAGISILLQGDALGRFIIASNQITSTGDGANPNLDGDGIHVRTESVAELALLTIDGNLIGVDIDGNNAGNIGDGIEIEMYQNSQAPDINITSNDIRFNSGNGVNMFRNGDAFIDNVLIDDNVMSNNALSGLSVLMGGGDINLNGGGPLAIDFFITNNFAQSNGVDGMFLHSTADADLVLHVDNNLISLNGDDGIDSGTDFFSQVRGEIQNNIITDNGNIGGHGIELTDSNSGDTSFDLDIIDNDILRNFEDGVNFFAVGGGTANVDLTDNLIARNGGDGVEAVTTFTAVADIDLVSGNIVEFNLQSGVEMLAEDLSIMNTTSSSNIIQNNGNDGWSFSTGDLSIAQVNAVLLDNIIRFNAARGVDIFNQWESDMDIEIRGSAPANPLGGSLIDSNGLQGILVVNEADPTRVEDLGLLTDNNIDFLLYQTEVRGNGTGAVSDDDGNGLYIRVGTSQFGRINAAVVDNHFSGNANIDVVTESFTATVNPPAEPEFDDVGAPNGDHRPDPLARLNFRLQGNVGQQIDVTRVGAFYDNEDEFKSIEGPNAPWFTTDPANRRRNAQREAADIDLTDGIAISLGNPAGTDEVTNQTVATEGTFSSTLFIGDDNDYVNAFVEFVNGPNAGIVRRINATAADDQTITVAEDFPSIPLVGDDFTAIAYGQAGIGQSTFVTEDASVNTNNTFDLVITDFGTAVTFVDANADEAAYPYTWTTGVAFPPVFP